MSQVQEITPWANPAAKASYPFPKNHVFTVPRDGFTVTDLANLKWDVEQTAADLVQLNPSIQSELSLLPRGTKLRLRQLGFDAEGFELVDVSLYKIHAEHLNVVHIMTAADCKWHAVLLNALRTEGSEMLTGHLWKVDQNWLLEAARAMNRGKNITEPPGCASVLTSIKWNSCLSACGHVRAKALLSRVAFQEPHAKLLHRMLVGEDRLCLPYAFANAVLLLLDESDPNELMHLPLDVFNQLSDEHGAIYKKYAATRPGEVPESWEKLTPSQFQVFLESKVGKSLLRWAAADRCYDQICDATLIKKPHKQSKHWSATQLHLHLVHCQAVFLLEIAQGHCVCVDTRLGQNPPLIYETDVKHTHAIPLSVESLHHLGWKDATNKVYGELREVRLKFKSKKQIPPGPEEPTPTHQQHTNKRKRVE